MKDETKILIGIAVVAWLMLRRPAAAAGTTLEEQYQSYIYANERGIAPPPAGYVRMSFEEFASAQEPHATGLIAPTDAERAWMDENLQATIYPLEISALGLQRLNDDRATRGLSPFDPSISWQWDSADSISPVQ